MRGSKINLTVQMLKKQLKIKPVEVVMVENKGNGSRCCIDLMSEIDESLGIEKGAGLLAGASSKGLFLIHSENIENPYVQKRTFRVNLGVVSLYTFVFPADEDGKYPTKYLWELSSGDQVVVADYLGNVAKAVVVRNKIESRPITMIKALHPTLINAYTGSLDFIHTFVQNAETTNFVDENGKPVPLKQLKPRDKIMACVENPHPIARHFGTPVFGIKIIEK